MIITALTLVTALAINSAFESLFKYYENYKIIRLFGPWIYAIIVTIITFSIIYSLKTYY